MDIPNYSTLIINLAPRGSNIRSYDLTGSRISLTNLRMLTSCWDGVTATSVINADDSTNTDNSNDSTNTNDNSNTNTDSSDNNST